MKFSLAQMRRFIFLVVGTFFLTAGTHSLHASASESDFSKYWKRVHCFDILAPHSYDTTIDSETLRMREFLDGLGVTSSSTISFASMLNIYQSIVDSWHPSAFSDPSSHRSDQFLYLVHSILDEHEIRARFARRELEETAYRAKKTPHQDLRLQDIDLQELNSRADRHVRRIISKIDGFIDRLPDLSLVQGLSASVITPAWSNTFGESGVILRPDFPYILATGPSDIGSGSGKSWTAMVTMNEEVPIRSPEHLLQLTQQQRFNPLESYNEVIVATQVENYPPLQAIGLFIRVDKHGHPLADRARVLTFERISKTHGLPLLYLEAPPIPSPTQRALAHLRSLGLQINHQMRVVQGL